MQLKTFCGHYCARADRHAIPLPLHCHFIAISKPLKNLKLYTQKRAGAWIPSGLLARGLHRQYIFELLVIF